MATEDWDYAPFPEDGERDWPHGQRWFMYPLLRTFYIKLRCPAFFSSPKTDPKKILLWSFFLSPHFFHPPTEPRSVFSCPKKVWQKSATADFCHTFKIVFFRTPLFTFHVMRFAFHIFNAFEFSAAAKFRREWAPLFQIANCVQRLSFPSLSI